MLSGFRSVLPTSDKSFLPSLELGENDDESGLSRQHFLHVHQRLFNIRCRSSRKSIPAVRVSLNRTNVEMENVELETNEYPTASLKFEAKR